MTKLPLAVIGTGHLGRIHAKLLSGMPDVDLVAVCDPVAEARTRAAAEASTLAVADYRDIVAQILGAVIATPTKHHHAIALDLARRGVHLLVEKPLAATLAQAEELQAAACRHGVILQVGHVERFNAAFHAARPHFEDVKFIEAVRAGTFSFRSTDIGVVLDLMIHDLDLVLEVVRSELRSVEAIGLAVLGRHEDVAHARLQFACGAVAHLSASRLSQTARRQMQVWGRHGVANVDFATRAASLVRPSAAVLNRELDVDGMSLDAIDQLKGELYSAHLRSEVLVVPEQNALAEELDDFKSCIRSKGQPRVDGAQACRVMAVAQQILDKMSAHRWDGTASGPVGPLAVPAAGHASRPAPAMGA